MTPSATATTVLRAFARSDREATDRVRLDYEGRFLRRKVLRTLGDRTFLVDLPETISLDEGDCFVLGDETLIEVIAAEEALQEVRGPDLIRLAWHIGNRHTPCQIEADRLLIQRDRVMADMLARLGARLSEVTEPFTPEGGAYGFGRTHGHDHGHGHVHGGNGHDGRNVAGTADDAP
ncbi:urease accessory protein ureE [Pseudooceanicola batsensis HTCC2597]|uniref:Urease accessory protein UreE n=1 Tax=Pseudooceanicola batsensis (strain ATCC BAA-863 / DSM 15984 / KCTC 12145 / HTCC2597) TaxID=252305 RepID=A3TTP3_PSEBH|nr:urease accessory protein UreE [Pseudooceanicola batsensis]EAQ05020.1 urease accessory protein ureE [Pseudooceanicola batsensis HTCC2597]